METKHLTTQHVFIAKAALLVKALNTHISMQRHTGFA